MMPRIMQMYNSIITIAFAFLLASYLFAPSVSEINLGDTQETYLMKASRKNNPSMSRKEGKQNGNTREQQTAFS